MPQPQITVSKPRETVQVTLDSGVVLSGAPGTAIGDFLHFADSDDNAPLIAAICNEELRELTYPIYKDSHLTPVTLATSDGGRIYRRSLVLLLVAAAAELWEGCQVSVRYAVPDGGFYCTRLDGDTFTDDDLERLANHMRYIVEEDTPINKRIVPLEEAARLFIDRREYDKARLLEQSNRAELVLYELRGYEDYYYGYMVRSAGVLHHFRLIPVSGGFILQYPRKEQPTQLQSIRAYNKLSAVFHQTDQWLQRMRVEDIGRLNQIIQHENRLHELILIAEALHEQNIAHIAGQIYEHYIKSDTRIVLIAGPSSSGKTTFAKRLAIQLLAHGLRPFTLELDNYFVDREKTPRDVEGNYNFEALNAIDLPLFNEQLLALINGKQVTTPRFDFLTGKSIPGNTVKLNQDQLIIIEGIHGLNPDLVPNVPSESLFRIYVSALTQLNIDSHNRVPTTDVRLLRRIVRDARHRGYTATDTLQRWHSVRRGEKNNIFPYQENANAMFNSAMVYELAALRPFAEPLLLQVRHRTPEHIEAKRLLSFLSWVLPLSSEQTDHIPDTSLLREFIGKSNLSNYHPGSLSMDNN